MRKHKWLFVVLPVLIAGIVLCAVRWQVWFGNPAEPEWTGDTLDYHFLTFAADTLPNFTQTEEGWQDLREPDTLQILLLGDVHNSMPRAEFDTLATRHPGLDCYAQLGDFVERGYFYYFQQLYSSLDSTFFATLPILTTPGNHEYRKGIPYRLSPLWTEVFPQPQNGLKDFLGTTYYVDFPNLRFIVIDSFGIQTMGELTRTLTWVKAVLRSAGDRFVVVMMHQPVYSCGAGRQNPFLYLAFRRALSKADLVFAGHDHNYSRRLPFVNTNAATKYYLNKVNPRDERICSGHRLYEVLTLAGDTLTMRTYLLESGILYDEVRITRVPLAAQADSTQRYAREHITEVIPVAQPELIDLPARYEGKNSSAIRRFRNRKAHRPIQ